MRAHSEIKESRHLLKKILPAAAFAVAVCWQCAAIAQAQEVVRPGMERGEAPSAPPAGIDRGRLVAQKEPDSRTRYRWLFGNQPAEPGQAPQDTSILEEFDRELKQARRLYLAGQVEQAVLKYRSAIDRIEALVDAVPPGHPLLNEMDERFQVFDEVVGKLLGPVHAEPKEDTAGQLFYLLEKRRICKRHLALKRAEIPAYFDVPRDLVSEEARVLKELGEIAKQGTPAGDRAGADALKARLAKIREALQQSSSRLTHLRSGVPVPLTEVRRDLLRKDEMILDFTFFRDRMVVGVIATESAVYHQVPVNAPELDKGVFNLQEKLREFTSGGQSSFMGHAWREPSRRVYRALFGNLPPLPDDKQVVFVIPERSLWYLPLSVLLDTEDRPFGRDRLVSLIPSVDMLKFIRSVPRRTVSPGKTPGLLLVESLPWVSEEDAKKAAARAANKKKKTRKTSEEERIEELIISSPVYPKPSQVVLKIQKLFSKFDVFVGPSATAERLTQYRDSLKALAVLALPCAVTDSVRPDHQPTVFFSPDKNGRRRFPVKELFDAPIASKLMLFPTCWFDVPDKEAPIGEGPLLLTVAMLYGGTPLAMINYSNPDWGNDDHYIETVAKKIAKGEPASRALAEYARTLPSGLDSSFSGRPPAWSGWVIVGDAGQTDAAPKVTSENEE
ncbi:MAG: CHAT domain-containing protein [Desulfomonile sp.]|nr:CHAT domain-containing protein [Desulfomonile sp.]